MTVKCRREDQTRFTALGFVLQEDEAGAVVELVDEEANYGHYDRLPTDIPFLAEHGAGGCYGPSIVACDGKTTITAECGFEGNGFVISWDNERNQPSRSSIEHVRELNKLEHRVRRIFEALKPTPA
jgi:hypothetical protein